MIDWNTELDEAPKDGTEILVRYTKQSNVSKIVNYNKVHKYWQSKGEPVLGLKHQPIVWIILPIYKGELKIPKIETSLSGDVGFCATIDGYQAIEGCGSHEEARQEANELLNDREEK